MLQRKIGILGGGQLGKMLCLAGGNMDLDIAILEKSKDFPAIPYARHFVEGDFKNYDDVYAFGKQVDILTIEIEHVNIEALQDLAKEGLEIHPNPSALAIIQDKGLQKDFYTENDLPTAPFVRYESKAEIIEALEKGTLSYPFVQKSRKGGYDGKGVVLINDLSDLPELFDLPSIIEPKVDMLKEISVVAARNPSGDIKCFEVVDMDFHPTANLVEFVSCPSDMTEEVQQKAIEIASKTIESFNISGLLAVEFFVDKKGEVLINEVAPRPHNSGHHTQNLCHTSQFEQHLFGILNLPLGNPAHHSPGVMINLLGDPAHQGPVKYVGVEESLALSGVYLHLYGKKETKPVRKMGHANISAATKAEAKEKARTVQSTFKIISNEN